MASHQSAVFRLARALTSSEAMAEDVLQEAFVAAWRHADGFKGDSSVRTWLLAIARNKAARVQRPRAGEPTSTVPLEHLGADAGWGTDPSPEQAAALGERRDALLEAMESLSEADRAVLVLRDMEGLSGPEAAALLDVGLSALKTRLHRARLRLMAALRRGGRSDQ